MLSATSMFCAAVLLMGNPCDPVKTLDYVLYQTHEDMAGEYWYQVRYRELKIGSLHETRSQSSSGEYVVKRSLRFSLMRNRITHVNERLVFSKEFPYRLLDAEQTTTVTHNDTTTVSRRVFPVGETANQSHTQLSYVATLAFHPRLKTRSDHVQTKSIDFANSRFKTSTWLVDESIHGDHDFDLTSVDELTKHAVASNGVPVRTEMPGGISMTIVDSPLDQPWEDNAYLFDSEAISI